MDEIRQFTIHLEQKEEFEFNVRFDWPEVDDLLLDEPAPLGGQQGPNAARLIAAGVANCLSASLLFCLQKSRTEHGAITAAVTGSIGRNEQKRLRLMGIDVDITLEAAPKDNKRLNRCLTLFEDFCVVTAAVRDGIPIGVRVLDEEGQVLHEEDQTT